MSNEVKIINRKFLVVFVTLISIILIMLTITVLTMLYVKNINIRYLIYFTILGSMLYLLSIFKRKFNELTIYSYLIKIRANQAKPLVMRKTNNLRNLGNSLINEKFEKYSEDDSHTLYFKITKDTIKKVFKKYILEVVVIIKKEKDSFYLDIVDENISKIQKEQLSKHKKIDKMLITQIKKVSDLNDKVKEAIKEIVFFKTRDGVISTINIGLHTITNNAILLYSDTYSPSLYYKYHIDFIKKII